MTIRATAANNNPDVPWRRRQSSPCSPGEPSTARCRQRRTPAPAQHARPPAAAAQPRAVLALPVPLARGGSGPCLPGEALAEPCTRTPAQARGSRRGRGTATVVHNPPRRRHNPVPRPDG